eukprot:1858804-Lingulodinium_polyedra.AAC.1
MSLDGLGAGTRSIDALLTGGDQRRLHKLQLERGRHAPGLDGETPEGRRRQRMRLRDRTSAAREA